MRMPAINPAAKRTRHPVVSFLIIISIFQAMGGLMGWITAKGVDGWYEGLAKSPLNPPDYLFGIVWTGLYFLLAVAFWVLWRQQPSQNRKNLLVFFGVHMILNWCWSPLFFMAHALLPSFLLIVVLFTMAGVLGWAFTKIDKRAALIFIPYMAWLGFAGHLAHYIWMHN